MSERNNNLIKTMRSIQQNLDAGNHWDQPAQLYLLVDDPEDPTARYVGKLEGRAADALTDAYDNGLHPTEKVHGLLVATEGWRHFLAEEVMAEHPEVVERVRQQVAEQGTEIPPDQMVNFFPQYFYRQVVPSLPPAGSMPPNMRKEIRVLTVVLRDATLISGAATRGKDDFHADAVPPELLGKASIPGRMYQLLHDARPVESDDPIRAVEDFKVLQSLEGL